MIEAGGSKPIPVTTERGDFQFDDPEWSQDGEYVMVRKNESGSPDTGRKPWLIHLSGGSGDGARWGG